MSAAVLPRIPPIIFVGAAATVGILVTVSHPEVAAILCAGAWALACLLYLPRRYSLAVPFCLLLSIPADHIVGLNGSVHGLFVLGATILLALASGLRDPVRGLRTTDWDLYLLAGVLSAVTLFHAHSGEIRGVLFWLAACFFIYWVRSEESVSFSPAVQIQGAIVAAGTFGGLFAVLERTGLLKVQDFVGAYVPNDLEFTYTMGSRAVGLSGHPLRLGTLTMLASITSLTWILYQNLPPRRLALAGMALAISLAGLILSGARGSWLAFAVAACVIVVSEGGVALRRRATAIASYAAGLAILLCVSGAWRLLYERAFGAGAHPESINQRVQVLQAVSHAWSHLPLWGLGFGGAAEFSVMMGLRVLNLEDEYIRFFLAGGLPALIVLITIAARRGIASARRLPSVGGTVALSCLIAMMINMATYNVFSWSIGPSLFFAIAYLAMPSGSRLEAV